MHRQKEKENEGELFYYVQSVYIGAIASFLPRETMNCDWTIFHQRFRTAIAFEIAASTEDSSKKLH